MLNHAISDRILQNIERKNLLKIIILLKYKYSKFRPLPKYKYSFRPIYLYKKKQWIMITSVLSGSFSVDSRDPPKQIKSRTITMNKLIEISYRKRYILIDSCIWTISTKKNINVSLKLPKYMEIIINI